MCTHRCYNFVRKNLVPLPCNWELNDSIDKGEIKFPVYKVDENHEDKQPMIQGEVHDQVQTVHHIVVPPEVWAEGHQKIEFIVTDDHVQ